MVTAGSGYLLGKHCDVGNELFCFFTSLYKLTSASEEILKHYIPKC